MDLEEKNRGVSTVSDKTLEELWACEGWIRINPSQRTFFTVCLEQYCVLAVYFGIEGIEEN